MNKWKKWSTVWIASLAMLAATFIPSVSVAFTPPPLFHPALEALCIQGESSSQAVHAKHLPSQHAAHGDHCPLCTKDGYLLYLPQPSDLVLARGERTTVARRAGPGIPLASIFWIHHPSRAPPAHS